MDFYTIFIDSLPVVVSVAVVGIGLYVKVGQIGRDQESVTRSLLVLKQGQKEMEATLVDIQKILAKVTEKAEHNERDINEIRKKVFNGGSK